MRPTLMRITSACAVALAAVAFSLVAALPAAAHDYVVSSTPDEGETLTEVPEFFVITTNQPMLDLTGERAGFGMQVTDASGQFYGDGCIDISGASMATASALGAAGEYTLTYQFVSADGHTVSDTLDFRYEPVDGASAQAGFDAAPQCSSVANDTGEGNEQPVTTTGETANVLGLVAIGLGALALVVVIIVVVSRARGRSERASDVRGGPE